MSDTGKIRSLDRVVRYTDGRVRKFPGKILTPSVGEHGHLFLYLYKNKKANRISVHTAVLLAFVGPKPPGCICLHGDGEPYNNNVSNLKWGTHKENSEDARRHGRIRTKDVCSNGHDLTDPSNVWISELRSGPRAGSTRRLCKLCNKSYKSRS